MITRRGCRKDGSWGPLLFSISSATPEPGWSWLLVGHRDPHPQLPHDLVRKTRLIPTRQGSKVPDRKQALSVRGTTEGEACFSFSF